MNYLRISFGIFLILAASRFIPHPPNFTSLIALSFYVPAIMGRKFIIPLIFSFFITDLFIGIHNTILFTYGSILVISFTTNFFSNNRTYRIIGVLTGSLIFFIITNLGFWLNGELYPLTPQGLWICYVMAIPFFSQTLISTIIYSAIIETLLHSKNFLKLLNNH